jgi:hypothetical protein
MTNPANSRTTSRGRVYTWKGESYWSVTTIIGNGLPKPALLPWGIKTVAEYAVTNHRILVDMLRRRRGQPEPDRQAAIDWLKGAPYRDRERAADLGSLIHARIESLILAKPEPPAPPVARGYLDAFDLFVAEWHPEFEAAEFTVYSRSEWYAGTGDWLARIPGHGLVLGDTKSGKDVYPEVALQLSAYRNGEFIGMPDGSEAPMPPVDECMALHLRADGTYSLVPVDAGPEAFRAFKYVREVFRFAEDLSKRVIGQPLVAPADETESPEVPSGGPD